MGCTSPNSSQPQSCYKCQNCGHIVSKINAKLHNCRIAMTQKNIQKQNHDTPILYTPNLSNPDPLDTSLYGNQIHKMEHQTLHKKVPKNSERTQFEWIKQETYFYPPSIKQMPVQRIRVRTFQQKLLWFRLKMQGLRIPWELGCQTLRVSRGNVLMSCFQQMKKINFHKEVKIKFDDQSVEDAGGLLREWIHLTIKQLFSAEAGIFELCDTHQTAYKIRWDKDIFAELALGYMWVLGVLIGKGIFERISIDCRINKTLIRQLCQQPIHLHDVYSLDKKLYSGWKSILETEGADNLFLNFSELKIHDDGTKQEIELIKEGMNVEVTEGNKKNYITQLINLHCTKSIYKYLEQLKHGISQVIPPGYLTIFEPHQFEMLMSGPSTIDVQDWKFNTLYKGYNQKDELIEQFWQIVEEYSQNQLASLLHYCTGSTRVPILGFKYLESNRNMVAKFTIQKSEYNKHNPYPKGHTCFNRLELPEYEQISQMKQRLDTIIKQEVSHFGLD